MAGRRERGIEGMRTMRRSTREAEIHGSAEGRDARKLTEKGKVTEQTKVSNRARRWKVDSVYCCAQESDLELTFIATMVHTQIADQPPAQTDQTGVENA